mmetsp:Transcript_50569/g.163769  ORF Transcript_50569/g.163769 Transcript_50569/m.163769 type:complete len:219 (-) Transcript_50569:107-763(-)
MAESTSAKPSDAKRHATVLQGPSIEWPAATNKASCGCEGVAPLSSKKCAVLSLPELMAASTAARPSKASWKSMSALPTSSNNPTVATKPREAATCNGGQDRRATTPDDVRPPSRCHSNVVSCAARETKKPKHASGSSRSQERKLVARSIPGAHSSPKAPWACSSAAATRTASSGRARRAQPLARAKRNAPEGPKQCNKRCVPPSPQCLSASTNRASNC